MKKLLAIFCLLIIFSCGSDDGDALVLTSIQIESSNGSKLDLNQTTTLSVNGLDQSNQAFNVTSTLTWAASNDNVAVDQSGVVTANKIGTATITVSTESIEAAIDIRVWDSSAPRTEIYVSDAGPSFKILKFDENGENPEVFTKENLAAPQDILFLEDQGVVLISNLSSGRINRHDVNTGEYISAFASGIGSPTRMKIGPDGLLYVLQWSGNGKVLRFELDGTKVDEFTSSGVNQSIGMDWDLQGNLYVSSFNSGSGGFVQRFNSEGAGTGKFITRNLQGPTDIWFSGGSLFINDWSAGTVQRFDGSGNFMGTFIRGMISNEGIAFISNNTWLIGNGGTGAVKMFSGGTFVKDFVPSGSAGLGLPNAVIIRKVNF